MKRLERILDRLTPQRWPVRWRLAAVSATLTLIILVIFAVVVGRLTQNRLQSDFDDDVRGTAATITGQTQVGIDPLSGRRNVFIAPGAPADGPRPQLGGVHRPSERSTGPRAPLAPQASARPTRRSSALATSRWPPSPC